MHCHTVHLSLGAPLSLCAVLWRRRFEFSAALAHGGSKIVLDAEQCRAIVPSLLQTHAIPAIASKRLLETQHAPGDGGVGVAVQGAARSNGPSD